MTKGETNGVDEHLRARKSWLATMALALLCGSAGAQDVQREAKHTVQQGDSLWGIAEQYLSNPFEWPEIWYSNSTIRNPHRIYPGQVVQIPSSELLGAEQKLIPVEMDTPSVGEVGAVPPSKSAKRGMVGQRPFYAKSVLIGYDDLDIQTRVVKIDSGRLLGGKGEKVRLNGKLAGSGRVAFYRPSEVIRDPKSGRKMAYELRHLGYGQLIQPAESDKVATVVINEARFEIVVGDIAAADNSELALTLAPTAGRSEHTVLRKYDTIGGPRDTHICSDGGPLRSASMVDDEVLLVSTATTSSIPEVNSSEADKHPSYKVAREMAGFAYVLAPRGSECVSVGSSISPSKLRLSQGRVDSEERK